MNVDKWHWRLRRVSEFLAEVVVGVSAAIAVAGGSRKRRPRGRQLHRKLLVASVYAIAAPALTAVAARQRRRW